MEADAGEDVFGRGMRFHRPVGLATPAGERVLWVSGPEKPLP